jgi:GxxExxY protein
MTENDVNRVIVDAAIEVHRVLGGPGLLESVYEEALVWELQDRGLGVERQRQVPLRYKGRVLGTTLRFDLRINGSVLVECKAVAESNRIIEVQMLTSLWLLDLRLGLVINFGERLVKDGLHRVVNGLC